MTKKDQRWVPYSELPAMEMGNGLHRRIMAFGDDLMCVENAFDTGAIGAVHKHPHTQVTYVVSGVFDFHIGDETRRVSAGDSMFVPGELPHGCDCLEAGAVLDIYSPMREDFLK